MNHTPATVAQFLADHSPQEFCSTCLALALNVSLQMVRNDLGRLSQELVLVRVGGTCAVCNRTTATYGLMPERDEPAEEIVAQLLTASPARTALCYSCLAQEARLSYHNAQRGAARLHAAGVTQFAIGRCTRCGRHRPLVQLDKGAGGVNRAGGLGGL
jgi:hypothetical protein